MLVLITYDVNTETSQGKKRLRKVAKECVNYGHRVQNSVFECVMDAAKCVEVKEKLKKVEHFGVNNSIDMEGVLMF